MRFIKKMYSLFNELYQNGHPVGDAKETCGGYKIDIPKKKKEHDDGSYMKIFLYFLTELK